MKNTNTFGIQFVMRILFMHVINGARNAQTREWAVDLLPYSIRVNAVVVGRGLDSIV